MKNRKGCYKWSLNIGLFLFFIHSFWSVANADADITFQGVLVDPPNCILNGKNDIYISFGDKIGVAKVATGEYRQPFVVGIECEENTHNMQLQLLWSGIAADFDSDNATVVTSEQENLGVKLYLNGQAVTLNKPLNIHSSDEINMEAVLVKEEGTELVDGHFTARVTLKAEYH